MIIFFLSKFIVKLSTVQGTGCQIFTKYIITQIFSLVNCFTENFLRAQAQFSTISPLSYKNIRG